MDGSIRLSSEERKTLWRTYRGASVARRALVLLLLAEGCSYRGIGKATFASATMIASVKRNFSAGGVARVLGSEERPVVVAYWLIVVVRWLLQNTPRDFACWRCCCGSGSASG